MPADYSRLAPGQEISRRKYLVDPGTIARYRDATGDETPVLTGDDGRELAPPMAVGALGLRGVISDLAIPGGTLHASQEFDFVEAVRVGETLECRATVSQNSTRGQWRFIAVQMEVLGPAGRKVLEGKSTIMVPLQG